MRHTRSTLTTKAMTDKTYILSKSNDNSSDYEFYFVNKKFHDTHKTNDKKEKENLPMTQMRQEQLVMLQKAMKTQN
jgi:hypothetical protein